MLEHLSIDIYAMLEMSVIGPLEHELTRKKIPCEPSIDRSREIVREHMYGDDSGFLISATTKRFDFDGCRFSIRQKLFLGVGTMRV